MGKITIAIFNDIKKEIEGFGFKGETYLDIIGRLIESAKKRQ